jgi:hypothetical protein
MHIKIENKNGSDLALASLEWIHVFCVSCLIFLKVKSLKTILQTEEADIGP